MNNKTLALAISIVLLVAAVATIICGAVLLGMEQDLRVRAGNTYNGDYYTDMSRGMSAITDNQEETVRVITNSFGTALLPFGVLELGLGIAILASTFAKKKGEKADDQPASAEKKDNDLPDF